MKDGWNPPERVNAVVESVEAGVIHSPAVGFAMDVRPAIRVIYTPIRYSGKVMLYLDRNGRVIPFRPDLEVEPRQRRREVA